MVGAYLHEAEQYWPRRLNRGAALLCLCHCYEWPATHVMIARTERSQAVHIADGAKPNSKCRNTIIQVPAETLLNSKLLESRNACRPADEL
jgi:hypothetical protein